MKVLIILSLAVFAYGSYPAPHGAQTYHPGNSYQQPSYQQAAYQQPAYTSDNNDNSYQQPAYQPARPVKHEDNGKLLRCYIQ